MSETSLPFFQRVWLAWLAYFRILFDGAFAAKVAGVRDARALPPPSELPPTKPSAGVETPKPPSTDAALQLLAILQREGRLVDFLEQDITAFKDDEIGAAARAVHAGSSKALRAHVTIEPVRTEEEGTKVELPEGFDPQEVKLSGDVKGSAPFRGVLRHRGWRASKVSLPVAVAGHDARIVAPAEVEI